MSNNLSIFNYGQTKVIFGMSALTLLSKELTRLQISKLLIVTDKALIRINVLEPLFHVLKEMALPYMVFDSVKPDPISSTVDDAVKLLQEERCNGVIGIGGGSVMDCAKCIAAMASNSGTLLDYDHANPEYLEFSKTSIPLISIPTTSGTGSEVSPYAVITNEKEHRKATIGSPSLISKVALLDPTFVKDLPKGATAMTGMDALTHCIEAYASKSSKNEPNPIIDALALKGIFLISKSLIVAYETGDMEARADMMWGSLIGGMVLPYGSGASHGLGNVLGGELHVPHGAAVGMLLPNVIRFNHMADQERYLDIAKAALLSSNREEVSIDSFICFLEDLLKKMNFPVLSDFVKDKHEIDHLAELAIKDKCTRINIKHVTKEDASQIYLETMERK